MNESTIRPLVTVIMSVYRAGEHLRPALESVLNQTYRELEVILIDDGDPSGCMESIADVGDPRVVILRQEHSGKATAVNRALTIARGEFYAIQDADDLCHPTRVERQVRAFLDNPDLGCVFCGFDLIFDGAHVAPLYRARSIEECGRMIDSFQMPGHDPTAMYRMSMVRDLEYEPSLAIGQGFDYVLRVGERAPMLALGECLYSYRVELDSHSRRDPIRRDEMVCAILARACARRGTPRESWPERLVNESMSIQVRHDPDNNLAAHFIEATLHLRQLGRFDEALRTAFISARARPLDPRYLKALVYACAPKAVVRLLRRRHVAV